MERFISALSITLLLSGFVAVAEVEPSSNPVDPVEQVVAAGLMSRSPSGDFRAEEAISRAELAAILVKTFHLEQRRSAYANLIQVQDVPNSHWAYGYIQLVLRNGIMAGYREGRFYPDQRVTRAEAFAIFAQAYGVFQFPDETIDEILASYPDAAKIPHWARKSMATSLQEGFVNLKESNKIAPLSPMTREDMAYALNSYLSRQGASGQLFWQTVKPLRS